MAWYHKYKSQMKLTDERYLEKRNPLVSEGVGSKILHYTSGAYMRKKRKPTIGHHLSRGGKVGGTAG